MADLAPPSIARRRAAELADAESAKLVDLSEVVTAPRLVVLVDVDALHPVERGTVMVLDALCHANVRLLLYSRAPSADVVKLRVDLPRAAWLQPSSAIQPSELVAVMKQMRADTRLLAIGIAPELRRAIDPTRDAIVTLASDDSSYQRTVLRATLWAIVKVRYQVRETIAE
ncbi:MAG: hypothetical protein HOV81_24905 [Kofleriaceae bacterium]|nr:hypothetical protein [Kofleriaceae bacterium]